MKRACFVLICCLAGCASFEGPYNEVNGYLTRRDSQACIDRARFYLEKSSLRASDKGVMLNLMGTCYSQIGYYDEALGSFGAAVDATDDAAVRSQALYQRALLRFSLQASEPAGGRHFDDGCRDIAEACRLMPGRYCNEYSQRKYPPTACP